MPSSTYQQVRDVLTEIQKIHGEVEAACRRLGKQTHDERLQLLADIVREHEHRYRCMLDAYEDSGDDSILDTWLQYTPTEQIEQAWDRKRLAEASSAAEIAEMVWDFEESLIQLYGQLAESTSAPRVQELFNSLLQSETAKAGQYTWSLEEFRDDTSENDPT